MLTLLSARGWEIKLNLQEQWNQGGRRYISGGVPLLPGQAMQSDELRLSVKDGAGKLKAVAAQIRPLAHWWRKDNSLRWVLVDFVTDLSPSETRHFYLTNEQIAPAEPKATVSAEVTDDHIVVNTGLARFTINRKHFNLIESAMINDVELLDASPDNGTIIEDMFGVKYYGSENCYSVEVVENGPLRLCVRARGAHKARAGAGYSAGMYQYDIFMNFYAGSSAVYLDLVLDNCFQQPIKEDDYLFRWLITGDRNWLLAGQRRSRNFRDVRAYRVDGQDSLSFTNWNSFAKAHRSEQWTKRALPNSDEAKRYMEGRYYRHEGWELPNPEHMTLDLLYDRYLLFGDQRAFENMRTVAAHGGLFRLRQVQIHRSTGWCWRTIERYWELTGDEQAEAMLRDTCAKYEKFIGQQPLWNQGDPAKHGSVWFTQVWSRALAMSLLHLRDPRMLELAKTAAEGKEDRADYFCTLFAVLYHVTGDKSYRQALLKKSDDGRKLLRAFDRGGDFPMESHWLLTTRPEPIKK